MVRRRRAAEVTGSPAAGGGVDVGALDPLAAYVASWSEPHRPPAGPGEAELVARAEPSRPEPSRPEPPAAEERVSRFLAAGPVHGRGYDRIVERVFDLPDPDDEYRALEAALVVGDREHDSLAAALDRAEDNARRAHRLYVAAKLDRDRYEADAEVVTAALREQATDVLQQQKAAGLRSKAITDADVLAQCAAMHPDEWRDIVDRRSRARLTVEHLERLADLWVSRCRSLTALLSARR